MVLALSVAHIITIATMTHKAIYTGTPPHIWLIWSSGTLHAELYGLPLLTCSLSLVVTSHLMLEVFARQLLLSGIAWGPILKSS